MAESLWGIIQPDAKIFSGSGFRVDKTDVGVYTILFDTAYNSVPAVTATQIYPWPMDPSSHGGDTRDNVVVVFIATDRVRIHTGDNTGAATDRAFSFDVNGQ